MTIFKTLEMSSTNPKDLRSARGLCLFTYSVLSHEPLGQEGTKNVKWCRTQICETCDTFQANIWMVLSICQYYFVYQRNAIGRIIMLPVRSLQLSPLHFVSSILRQQPYKDHYSCPLSTLCHLSSSSSHTKNAHYHLEKLIKKAALLNFKFSFNSQSYIS